MVIRTYFSKNNTIVKNNVVNTGKNPVTELFYGGSDAKNTYSRFLIYFDHNRLKSFYTGGTFTDLSKLTHTLKLTNTGSFDKKLMNGEFYGKERSSSFDLIVFKVNQEWDEGTGYDYDYSNTDFGEVILSVRPSNWIESQTGIDWNNGTGVYSGSPTSITIGTQHFDFGNENISIDITPYVNGLLTGDTNYGIGIAYARGFELLETTKPQYVGFFTRHTQTFYQPYLESIYSNHITDDRTNFYLDKNNKLYLYVNVNGQPTNLDSNPSVTILDNEGNVFSAITSTAVTQVSKGVYAIDIIVPTTSENSCTMFEDVWSGITINGVQRPPISLNFALKDSNQYYNIGDASTSSQDIAISVSGIKINERIKAGELRKVIVSARIPYTVNQTQTVGSLKYKLYVLEGKNQLTVIDDQPLEMANGQYYFLLDTLSLVPHTYYLDIIAENNQEIRIMEGVLSFEVVSQVNARNSQ